MDLEKDGWIVELMEAKTWANRWICRQMDGWMDVQLDGGMESLSDRWVEILMMDVKIGKWMNGQICLLEEQVGGWMKRWMGEKTDRKK